MLPGRGVALPAPYTYHSPTTSASISGTSLAVFPKTHPALHYLLVTSKILPFLHPKAAAKRGHSTPNQALG